MTPKLEAALRQAREALEALFRTEPGCYNAAYIAITAIDEALVEQPCKYPHCPYPCPDLPDCRDAEQPASKPWVGLTDDEREELMDTYDVASTDYAQAIEAKLREKNA